MKDNIIEIDNFLPDPDSVRKFAINSEFADLSATDGQVYKRILPCEIKGLTSIIEQHMGSVFILGQGFRLNYEDEEPNNGIHIDTDWGSHALVLYLSNHPDNSVATGTAFFDSTDDNARMLYLCKEVYNKAVIYRSDLPHSRWPLKAYGKSPEDGRLIIVAFFTPISEL